VRVLVTTPVFPPDLGGPAVYVPSFARFLLERGHQVKVVAFCSDPAPSGYPFEVVSIVPNGPLPLRYIKAFFVVLREVRGCDVVYVNEHLALLHVLAARLRRVPAAIRIMVDGAWEISHRKGWCGDDDIVTFQGKRYGWRVSLTRGLQRRWWTWCRHIVACSQFLRQILIRSYGVPPDKVQRIFNAYHGPEAESVPETREEARARVGLDPSRRYLLTICRLMVWKKVDGILRALAELPEDVHFLIAGEGDMEQPWRELAQDLGLADRVQFLGNQPHERIPLYLRAADVFVLNSRYEGLSHTLLEALHLGTPIVASGVCGNPEVIEHEVNGLLVDPLDVGQLRDAIRRLLDDPEYAADLARAGLGRRAQFEREATFAEVEAALARAASG
jgi:glycosyltransferase involved in cell wall biosynthesis